MCWIYQRRLTPSTMHIILLTRLKSSFGITNHHGLPSCFNDDDRHISTSVVHRKRCYQISRVNSCISEINDSMVSSRFKLNRDITDILRCATKKRQRLLDISPVLLRVAIVNPLAVVKDLRVLISNDLSTTAFVNLLVGRCFLTSFPY